MTTGDALLAAVLDMPDDDGPRLVYADWLDDHGQEERAAFIRAEVAKARTGLTACPSHKGHQWRSPSWGCGACDFCRLEIECERHHEDGLLWDAVSGLSGIEFAGGYAHTSRHPSRFADEAPSQFTTLFTARGFVGEVHCSAGIWLAVADAITAAHPIRRVVLTTMPGDLRAGFVGYEADGSTVRFMVAGRMVRITGNADDSTLLAARWPGVRFELPPVADPYYPFEGFDAFEAFRELGRRTAEAQERAFLAALARPATNGGGGNYAAAVMDAHRHRFDPPEWVEHDDPNAIRRADVTITGEIDPPR